MAASGVAEAGGGWTAGARRGRRFRREGSAVQARICASTRRCASAGSQPSALADALDPAPFDQPAVLEAIQGGVQRRDVKADGPARPRVDQLSDLVAVAPAFFEEGEDEELRAPALQLPFELLRGHISWQLI